MVRFQMVRKNFWRPALPCFKILYSNPIGYGGHQPPPPPPPLSPTHILLPWLPISQWIDLKMFLNFESVHLIRRSSYIQYTNYFLRSSCDTVNLLISVVDRDLTRQSNSMVDSTTARTIRSGIRYDKLDILNHFCTLLQLQLPRLFISQRSA